MQEAAELDVDVSQGSIHCSHLYAEVVQVCFRAGSVCVSWVVKIGSVHDICQLMLTQLSASYFTNGCLSDFCFDTMYS